MVMSLLVALAIVAAATCQGSDDMSNSLPIPMSRKNPSANGPAENILNSDADNQEVRIYYGDDAMRGEFPFMVRVYVVVYGTTYQCGGALIAQRVVVTAAHCLAGSTSDATVVLGDHTDSADPQETYLSVASWISHPDYDEGNLSNDIGLIYLGSDADLTNPYITTISLPTSNDEWMYEEGESVTVIGWGGTERDSLAETLKKLTYKFVSEETCREYWEESIKDGMVCTGAMPANASHSWAGDSGGPLFSTEQSDGSDSWTLLALVSWGVSDDSVHTWDVNTDVLYYVDWIRAYSGMGGDDGNVTFKFWDMNGSSSKGVVLGSTEPEDDSSWAVICNDGIGRNEVKALCRYMGFSTGILIDPYSLDGKYDLTEYFSYAATEVSCEYGAEDPNDCEWTAYEDTQVPCVDGQQAAVSCADQAFELEIYEMSSSVNNKGKAKFECYARASRYGMDMDLKDEGEAFIANRNSTGGYSIVMYDEDLKYKKKNDYWKGKVFTDLEYDDRCFICVVGLKNTWHMDLKVDPDCSYGWTDEDVWNEVLEGEDDESEEYKHQKMTAWRNKQNNKHKKK